MRKLISIFDLTRLNERYCCLATDQAKKQFIRTVYTLSLCAVAIIFIWYNGIASLNIKKENLLSPIELSLKKLPLLGDNKFAEDIKNNTVLQNKTDEKSTIKQQVKNIKDIIIDVPKTSVPEKALPEKLVADTSVNQAKDQATKKNYGIVKKTIYMGANTSQVSITFDDGYNKKTVEKVLDVLKKENIKTTFFIIGKAIKAYPDVWKRAIAEGHQICNHTNYHEVLTNMPDKLVQEEIIGWETTVKKALGEEYLNKMKSEFPFLRLPGGGGERSDRILSIAQKNGYTVVGWNLETFSSVINPLRKTNSEQDISNKIQQHIVSRCSKGSIILLHFNQYDTANIEGILQGVKKRGFDIQPLSQVIK